MKQNPTAIVLALVIMGWLMPQRALPCGQATHGEVAHRAVWAFDAEAYPAYGQRILDHPDALQAGARFPDWGWSFGYGDESSAAHGEPFVMAAANHLHETYPAPWDEETEKAAVFLLGVTSHHAADDSWHTEGREGFIKVMGMQDFNGSFGQAHTVGDFGGDVLCAYEMNLGWMAASWYVPIEDMVQVYQELGYSQVTPEILTFCNYLLFLASHAERLWSAALFPMFATPSPFMVEQFHDYFTGGLAEMATWTAWRWPDVIDWMENGAPTGALHVDRHVLSLDEHLMGRMSVALELLSRDDLKVSLERTGRGVTFRLDSLQGGPPALGPEATTPRADGRSASYTVGTPYAYMGTSLAVGDFDRDGMDDLAMGGPGYGLQGHPQLGVVHVTYGRDAIIGGEPVDLSVRGADITLAGADAFGRFGWALAVVDLNADDLDDLAVSAPTIGSQSLQYRGRVFVYYGIPDGTGLSAEPGLTITADEDDTNLGWSLTSGDCDSDGRADLIIGAPFSGDRGTQRGQAALFLSSTPRSQGVSIPLTDADWIAAGEKDYDWFGYHAAVAEVQGGGRLLLVGAPTVNSQEGLQSVGRLYGFDISTQARRYKGKAPVFTITGTGEFDKAASCFALGDPLGSGDTLLAISSPTMQIGENVQSGSIALIPLEGLQGDLRMDEIEPLTVLYGDQAFARLGWRIGFSDFNGDGTVDLWAAEPWRKTGSSMEAGALYLWLGGGTFPTGSVVDCTTSATLAIQPPAPRTLFGSTLAFPDFNGDGADDVAIAARRASAGARQAGAVYLSLAPGSISEF